MTKHEVAFAEEMKLANTRISVSSHKLLEEYAKEARLVHQEQHELVEEQNNAAFCEYESHAFFISLKPSRPEIGKHPAMGWGHRVPAHFRERETRPCTWNMLLVS